MTAAAGGGGEASILVSKYFSARGRGAGAAAVPCSSRLPLRGGTLGTDLLAAAAAAGDDNAAAGITVGGDDDDAGAVFGNRGLSTPTAAGVAGALLVSEF